MNVFETTQRISQTQTKVSEAEIRSTMFFIEHNLPFVLADHFVALLKTMGESSLKADL